MPARSVPSPPPTASLRSTPPTRRPRHQRGSPPSATPCVSRPCSPLHRAPAPCARSRSPDRYQPTVDSSFVLLCDRAVLFAHRLARRSDAPGHGPKEDTLTAAPTHVLQPTPTSTDRATSLIRGIRDQPGVAISRTRPAPTQVLPQTPSRRHPPDQPGSHNATLEPQPRGGSPGTDVPYMTR